MISRRLLPAILAALLFCGGAQAREPVGTFGEWTAECERISQSALCSITATPESWGGDVVTLHYSPTTRSLSVVVPEQRLGVTARIDRGAAINGDCLSMYCEFTRGGFGAALEQGTVLFVTVTGNGKKTLTFAKNLLDLRKAVAAAKEWAEGKQRGAQ